MAKTISNKGVEELRTEIDDLDAEISAHGEAAARARKAQRPLLKRKDELVNTLNDRLRADGSAITLGDNGA